MELVQNLVQNVASGKAHCGMRCVDRRFLLPTPTSPEGRDQQFVAVEDPKKYPAAELFTLRMRRWDVEEYQPHYPSSASFYQLAA